MFVNITALFNNWEHYVKAYGIGYLATQGLVAYSVIMFVIIRDRKSLNNCFYPYIICLGCFDCIMLCIWLFYSVPCTLLQRHWISYRFDAYIGALSNGTYFGGLATVFSISLNRYWGVCRNFTYDDIFSRRRVTINIIIIWIIAIVSGGINALPCCYLHYYYELSIWSYDVVLWGFDYFVWWEHFAMVVTGVSILLSYGAIGLTLHRSNRFLRRNQMVNESRQHRNQMNEARLAGSFFSYGIYVLIESPLFTFLPLVTDDRWALYGGCAISYVILCAINPFLYLITNRSLRKKLFRGLKKGKPRPHGTPDVSSRIRWLSNPNSRKTTLTTTSASNLNEVESRRSVTTGSAPNLNDTTVRRNTIVTIPASTPSIGSQHKISFDATYIRNYGRNNGTKLSCVRKQKFSFARI